MKPQNFEKIGCSLDMALRLKEAGIKQDGYFSYVIVNDSKLRVMSQAEQDWDPREKVKLAAAFTIGEIIDKMPKGDLFITGGFQDTGEVNTDWQTWEQLRARTYIAINYNYKFIEKWFLEFLSGNTKMHFSHENLADALAAYWLRRLELEEAKDEKN